MALNWNVLDENYTKFLNERLTTLVQEASGDMDILIDHLAEEWANMYSGQSEFYTQFVNSAVAGIGGLIKEDSIEGAIEAFMPKIREAFVPNQDPTQAIDGISEAVAEFWMNTEWEPVPPHTTATINAMTKDTIKISIVAALTDLIMRFNSGGAPVTNEEFVNTMKEAIEQGVYVDCDFPNPTPPPDSITIPYPIR